jgi:hypothetical protein
MRVWRSSARGTPCCCFRGSADLLRFAAVHLADPSLAALRAVQAAISIYDWFDAWCLGLAA